MAWSEVLDVKLTASIVTLFSFAYTIYKDQIRDTESAVKAKELGSILRAQAGKKCRIRLDDDSSATVTLPDHRKLGYAEYGQPDGKPIIMLHGLPGSRLEMAWHDEHAKEVGARIIGVDRPGVGWSSPHPGRTLRTFAGDVEHLAQHLGLEKFAVIGTSGGGPYVMACAAYLPASKLKAVANVCGMGDIQTFKSIGMGWPNWLGFRYAIHWAPWLFRWHARHWPVSRVDLSEEERLQLWICDIEGSSVPSQDLDAWAALDVDFLRLSLRAGREFFQDGYDTLLQDAALLGSKWEFRVEDIRPDLSIHLWFGKHDKNVSGYHGVEIADRFRGKTKLQYLDETHLSLQVKYHDQILDDLIAEL